MQISDLKLEKVKNIRRIPVGWAWLIVVVLGAVLSFYYFSVRPEQIKKECYVYRKLISYEECLIKHGL